MSYQRGTKRSSEEMENNNILVNGIPYNPVSGIWDLSGFHSILDAITPKVKTPAHLALEEIIRNKKVKTVHSTLNPNAPEFIPSTEVEGLAYNFELKPPTEIINVQFPLTNVTNSSPDLFEPPAIVRKQGINTIGQENLDSVKENLLAKFDETNDNLQSFNGGEKFTCRDKEEQVVSKVVVWPRSSGNELLEIVRFDKSWPSFKDNRRSFKSFEEWNEFCEEELQKPKQVQQTNTADIELEFIGSYPDDDGFIINFNNPNDICMDAYEEDGIFFSCYNNGQLISQVFFREGYKLNNVLVEKRRKNQSWRQLGSDRKEFNNFKEWRNFILSSLM
jgi:hypothetical protein